jgi:hypothetical protein
MEYLLVALIILGAILLFLTGKKASRDSKGVSPAGISIPMTKEEVESAQRSNDEVMKLLKAKLVASGHFKNDKVPALIEKLRSGYVPFGRINTMLSFDGDTFLTVGEKRALGMNDPAASCGVSTPTTTAKVCAPRGGELESEIRFLSL